MRERQQKRERIYAFQKYSNNKIKLKSFSLRKVKFFVLSEPFQPTLFSYSGSHLHFVLPYINLIQNNSLQVFKKR